MNHRSIARRTPHGYLAVGPSPVPCQTPVVFDSAMNLERLSITDTWVRSCFMPAYRRARTAWGPNARAIAQEIVSDLSPDIRLLSPATGAERELLRRVDAAVAALLNESGVPTRYPADPKTPRPTSMPTGAPWYRALMTGWLR